MNSIGTKATSSAGTLLDVADILAEARALAAFVQSIAVNVGHKNSILLNPDQLDGMSYAMQDIIDRIKCAESAIWARGYLADTTTDGKTKEVGAMAAHAALRNIEEISKKRESKGAYLSMAEWWASEDGAVKALQQAAGPQNDFMSGFIAALAEYLLPASTGSFFNLENWKPEAALTESEKMAAREKFGKEVEGMQSEPA